MLVWRQHAMAKDLLHLPELAPGSTPKLPAALPPETDVQITDIASNQDLPPLEIEDQLERVAACTAALAGGELPPIIDLLTRVPENSAAPGHTCPG